jgi:hypothetical protein
MTRGLVRFVRRNAIGLLALFVALSGTTYAASSALLPKNSVGSAQVINGSLQTKDLSKKARRSLKGNRGPRGFAGRRGPTGLPGVKGATGVTGAPGTALGFAAVHGDGTLSTPASLNKNITAANISHPGTGVYCFHGLPFTPHSAVATGANGFGANFTLATVEINGRDGNTFTGECVATDQARVRTVVVPSGGSYTPSALADEVFYVWFN